MPQCIQVEGQDLAQGQDRAQGQDLALQAAVTPPPAGKVLKVIHARFISNPSTAQPMDNLVEDGRGAGDPSHDMQTVQDALLWMPVALVVVVLAERQLNQTSRSSDVAHKE